MILADPQFGMAVHLQKKHEGATEPPGIGVAVAPPGTPDSGWPYETARLERAIAIANDLKPEFVVVLGDMVMNWNNRQQGADLLAAFEKLSPEIPVHYVPGNHDVGVDFLAATDESLAAYREKFGADRFTFVAGPCRYVAFNSALFDQPQSVPHEHDMQFEWLEEELARPLPEGVSQTVAFAHHPPFIKDIDEEYGVYNLPQPGRQRLADLLIRNGVRYVFTGHTHANVLSRYKELRVIATSAIGISRNGHASGYRLVRATPDSISHSFYVLPKD